MAKSPRGSRFGCCMMFFLFVLLPIGAILGLLIWAGSKAPSLEPGTALEIRIAGELREGPPQRGLEALFDREDPSVWSIRQALRAAANEPKITGVFLDILHFQNGMAVVEELQEDFAVFRASGKPVHAFLRGDMVGDGDYLLALAADQIVLMPEGGLLVNGFNAEVTFWRGLLDKLGIVPYVFMLKEYKSAGEPYSRYEMSEPFRESLQAVLEDMMGFTVKNIAERRKLDEQTVRGLIDRGMLSGNEALQARLVDKLGYRDQLEQAFIDAGKVGEYRSIEPADYLMTLREMDDTLPEIAVLFAEGPIVASDEGGFNPFDPGGRQIFGPELAKGIQEAAEDSSIRAIVLRVNSPGGSPVGSDHVYRAIQKAQGRGKKVIVSMSEVAGSGGYWIAMNADAIVAQPTTITGSIGVVFQKLDLKGLYNLVGANISQVKMGENADLMSETTDLAGARGERVLASMTEIYESFKKKVAEGRKLSVDQVEQIARGRIWSGQDALEHKLVDQLGGLQVAIDLAKEKAGLKKEQKVRYVLFPKPEGVLEQMLARDFVSTRLPRALRSWIAPEQVLIPDLEAVRSQAQPSIQVLSPTLRLN